MEEKKTKKMTKAEAFEWLKGKKIMCYAGIANIFDEADKVEKFLKEVGCNYYFANHINWREWYHHLYGFLIDSDGDMYVVFENQRDSFKKSPLAPIEVSDLLSIEIVEDYEVSEHKFSEHVSSLQEQLGDDQVLIITKTNYLTMNK